MAAWVRAKATNAQGPEPFLSIQRVRSAAMDWLAMVCRARVRRWRRWRRMPSDTAPMPLRSGTVLRAMSSGAVRAMPMRAKASDRAMPLPTDRANSASWRRYQGPRMITLSPIPALWRPWVKRMGAKTVAKAPISAKVRKRAAMRKRPALMPTRDHCKAKDQKRGLMRGLLWGVTPRRNGRSSSRWVSMPRQSAMEAGYADIDPCAEVR